MTQVPNGGVPLVDFSILGDLGKVYDESRRRAQREAILSSIPPDATTQSLGTLGLQLMRAGDAESGIPLARLGDAALRDARDFDWRRQEARRAQGNTDRILALKERLAGAGPRGFVYRDGDSPPAPRTMGAIPAGAVLALKAAPELRNAFIAQYGDGAADPPGPAYESPFGRFSPFSPPAAGYEPLAGVNDRRTGFYVPPPDTPAPLPVAMDPRRDPFKRPEILEGGGSGGGGGSIFRSGTKGAKNLTPRPHEEELSFRDSLSNPYPKGDRPVFKPGGEAIEMDSSKLPPGSVTRDNVPPGHVGVKPTPLEVLLDAFIKSWKFPK